jgi:hypothetical protein
MRAHPAALNQPFRAQDAQPLGDGGKLLVRCRHDLRDATLAVRQQLEDLQPRGIAQGAEQPGRPFQSGNTAGGCRLPAAGVVARLTGRNALADGPTPDRFHYFNN